MLKNKDVIRLEHLNTHKFLHSHLHQSPLSGNQEVSAFAPGDTGDHWKLEVKGKWDRNEKFRLKHIDTGAYLSMTDKKYGRPIPNQHEIMATKEKNADSFWFAAVRVLDGVC